VIPAPIVADGAIASLSAGNGKLVPVVIIDGSVRPDLASAIRIHKNFDAGDVKVQWGGLPNSDHKVALFLTFVRPTELNAVIEFDIVHHGALVENILMARMMYLQAGKPGDRLSANLEVPMLLVEVVETGFRPYWDKRFLKGVSNYFRSNGCNRADAKRRAQTVIDEIKQLATLRASGGHNFLDDQQQ
jgi:hypothetical protein